MGRSSVRSSDHGRQYLVRSTSGSGTLFSARPGRAGFLAGHQHPGDGNVWNTTSGLKADARSLNLGGRAVTSGGTFTFAGSEIKQFARRTFAALRAVFVTAGRRDR